MNSSLAIRRAPVYDKPSDSIGLAMTGVSAQEKPENHGASIVEACQSEIAALAEVQVDTSGPMGGSTVVNAEKRLTTPKLSFSRCSGSHDTSGNSATGKALLRDFTQTKGYDYLKNFTAHGSPAAVRIRGTSGDLTKTEGYPKGRYLSVIASNE